jgi:hypothetical protein
MKNSFFQKFSNYIVPTIVYSVLIGVFSVFMIIVVNERTRISDYNNSNLTRIYSGSLNQIAPNLNKISEYSDYAKQNALTNEQIKSYIENTFLVSTKGKVDIYADFVKKGLEYYPSYKTEFASIYKLSNTLNEKSFVNFEFPFPIGSDTHEISGVKLSVNGVEKNHTKAKIDIGGVSYDGLKWEGEIPADGVIDVEVTYSTVGLALFRYEGMENPLGSQNLNFDVTVHGTRSYDIAEGLSVDNREFGDNQVKLSWNKTGLYSKPLISVNVGGVLNPSRQVSRVYFVMAPLYVVFSIVLIFFVESSGKTLKFIDVSLSTLLYVLFFPLFHYLSSFTIDPTMQAFSAFPNINYFTMPLYLAFAIAWGLIILLYSYLFAKVVDLKFVISKVPFLALLLGFFPIVVTIPEFTVLLALVGVVFLSVIAITIRPKLKA